MGNNINPAEDYKKHIKDGDTWSIENSSRPILSHEFIERLARIYGVKVYRYEWYKTDLHDQMMMIEVTGFHEDGRITPEVGEVNKESLAGDISNKYPHSICWKRAYDRAVLKHLGIEAYSAEEAAEFKKRGGGRTNARTSSTGTNQSGRATTLTNAPTNSSSTAGGSGKPAEASQKRGITATLRLLSTKGQSVDQVAIIKDVAPNKSSLDEITYDEASQIIQNLNGMLSSLARGEG